MTKTLTATGLRQFTGSEHWHRHGLVKSVLYTEGAKYVADAGGAYWLWDEIALVQRFSKAVAAEPFPVWTLVVRSGHSATLTCEGGNGHSVITASSLLCFSSCPGSCSAAISRPRRRSSRW
jgi:hypothetical protein